jgi:DNA-binding response OmpR family regulator
MPRRRKLHLLIIDRSVLARNMYTLLFANPGYYYLSYADDVDKLKKLRTHEKPDILILNSNVLGRGESFQRGRIPTILLCGADRHDLREEYEGAKGLALVEKPFYPYGLMSIVSQLLNSQTKKKPVVKRKKSEKK